MQLNPAKIFTLDTETWSTPAILLRPLSLIIAADRSGKVYAFEIAKPEPVWVKSLGKIITASPTLADINNDGIEEIIIGTQDEGVLFALNHKGDILWSTKCGSSIRSSVAVALLNNNANPKIIVSAYGNYMVCLEAATGKVEWKKYLGKHEYSRAVGIVSSPLIADVDLDGELEIVSGSRFKMGFCLSLQTGKLKWVHSFSYDPDSTPSFAIIDGKPLVFIGGGEHTSGVGDNAMYALNGNDGSIYWRTKVHGGLDSCPVISDVDNDEKPEVVITSLADASCYCFDATNGNIKWQYKFSKTGTCYHDKYNVCRPVSTKTYFTENAVCRSYTTPLVADINNDGIKEVIVGSCNGLWVALNGKTGNSLIELQTDGLVRGSPVAVDADNDGKAELVISSGKQLLVYKLENSNINWRMFNGDTTHACDMKDYESIAPTTQHLKKQRFAATKYVWYWLIKDAGRFTLFHLERRVLKHLGIKLYKYYY